MRASLLLLAVLLSFSAPPLAAQSMLYLAEVQPGARIRVQAPGIVAGRYVGTVLTRTGDTVSLGNPAGAPISLPLRAVESLEISRGKSRSDGALRGIQWGAPIGLAFGLFAAAIGNDCQSCANEPTDAQGVALATVGGALWGAGIGALVGRERWERFTLTARTSLRFDPAARRVALALRL